MPGPVFSPEMLKDEVSRQHIAEGLEQKVWQVKVERTGPAFGFVSHDNFASAIIAFATDFPELALLKPGDRLSVRIGIQRDKKKGGYNFKAIPTFLKGKHIFDANFASLRQAVHKESRRTLPQAVSSPEVCIYIDERWPGTEDDAAAEHNGIGIIAGIVWDGPEPDESVLPLIPNHLRDPSEMVRAFTGLLGCSRALPFIFEFRTPYDDPRPMYGRMISLVLKILLGWMVAPDGEGQRGVRIILEEIKGYRDGTERNEFFQGVFSEAALLLPRRFRQWSLRQVVWRAKSSGATGYIPYADLLPTLVKSSSAHREELAALVNYRLMPGFVPVSPTLLPLLNSCEKEDDPAAILALLNELRGTHLGTMMLGRLQKKLRHSVSLRDRLVLSLEERFLPNERDLRVLRRLTAEIGEAVGAPGSLPPRSQFIWHLIALQDANHHGDPALALRYLTHFEDLRDQLAPSDPGLVAYADLNLIVHLNDQFRFQEALRLNRRLADLRDRLPRQVFGRVMSSLGQCNSIAGHYAEAASCFETALAAFAAEAKLGYDMGKDIDKTSVYRAMNAIDGGLPGAGELIAEVVGDPFLAAAALAVQATPGTGYHHHLLLRGIWYGALAAEVGECYLAQQERWETGENMHPWELIALYRALLVQEPERAKFWYALAVEVASDPAHGATLALIGAVVATVAFCRTQEPGFKERALRLIEKAAPTLPETGFLRSGLRAALESPAAGDSRRLLGGLPFNYH